MEERNMVTGLEKQSLQGPEGGADGREKGGVC